MKRISIFIKFILFSLNHHIRISDNINTVEIVNSDLMGWFERRFNPSTYLIKYEAYSNLLRNNAQRSVIILGRFCVCSATDRRSAGRASSDCFCRTEIRS